MLPCLGVFVDRWLVTKLTCPVVVTGRPTHVERVSIKDDGYQKPRSFPASIPRSKRSLHQYFQIPWDPELGRASGRLSYGNWIVPWE